MMAGDDFADMYDTFAKLPIARSWRWGVKSAVARFSREVSTRTVLATVLHLRVSSRTCDYAF
jgi:hypothetical protein